MGVEIEWIDSISAAATGNKIYRDTVPSTGKVEVADIANGNQIYQDDTAEVGTGVEYKYSIQTHDGAGDETTQEVEGENMDFIETAGASIINYVFDGSLTSFMADESATPTMLDGIINQTFVVRVQMTQSDHQHGILGLFGSTLGVKLEVDANDNLADGDLRDTGESLFVNGALSNDNQWHNLFMFYDGTNIGVYEDNNLGRSTVDADFVGRTPSRALAVGAAVIGGGTPGYLIGKISDVQFYNKRLSVQEIADLNIDLTDTASGLIANFAGNKTETEWTSEIGGYVLTNQGGVITE